MRPGPGGSSSPCCSAWGWRWGSAAAGRSTTARRLLATYAVAMVGLRRSLRRWPWAEIQSRVYDPSKGFVVEGKPIPLGWPFDRLGPRVDPPKGRLGAAEKVLWCLLFGWWCYVLERAIGGFDGQMFVRVVLVIYLTMFVALGRLVMTVGGHAPPISLFGRIARLRPLIPSYDQVFLAPFAAAFVAAAGPFTLEHAGVPSDVAIAVSGSVALMAIALGGPDRRAWQLTARCRVVSGIAGTGKAGEFVQTG